MPVSKDQIICGDALSEMRRLPSNSYDLIFTSPPYNKGGFVRFRTGKSIPKNPARKERYKYQGSADALPAQEYIAGQRESVSQMLRLVKPTGAVFYNHRPAIHGGNLIDYGRAICDGFPLRQIIVWASNGGVNWQPTFYLPRHEWIYLLAKPAFRLRRHGVALSSVWQVSQEKDNPHPASFPVKLVRQAIWSCFGDTILDPFAGSGTVGVAAIQEGWGYTLIDASLDYCRLARSRCRTAQPALALGQRIAHLQLRH